MTKQEMQKKEARIGAIRKKMDEIPAMLDGTLMVKHNRVRRKDGSVHVSAGYHTFQYRGADGRRKWKRIPQNAKAAVERLVRAARRYRKLDQEYSALLTELSLVQGGKKND
jgi:hypothetical protein